MGTRKQTTPTGVKIIPNDIIWSKQDYNVKEFVENFKNKFPVLIQLSHGYCAYGEDMFTYSTQEVYMVTHLNRQRRIVAKDTTRNNLLSIPIEYPLKFRTLTNGVESPAYTLEEIQYYGNISPGLQLIPKNKSLEFRVGVDGAEKAKMANLVVTDAYDDQYLVANLVSEGYIYGKGVYIPLFVKIGIYVAVGLKNGTEADFYEFITKCASDEKCRDNGIVRGNPEIMLFEEDHRNDFYDYVYMEPSTYMAFSAVRSSPGSDSVKDSSPAYPSRPPHLKNDPPKTRIKPIVKNHPQKAKGQKARSQDQHSIVDELQKLHINRQQQADESQYQPIENLPPKSVETYTDLLLSPKPGETTSPPPRPTAPKPQLHRDLPTAPTNPYISLEYEDDELYDTIDTIQPATSNNNKIPPPLLHPKPKTKPKPNPKTENQQSVTAPELEKQEPEELYYNLVFKDISQIPLSLTGLSKSGVANCLKFIHLDKYVPAFLRNDVDGDLVYSLDLDILMSDDFGMSLFEAKKLIKFRDEAWRPKE